MLQAAAVMYSDNPHRAAEQESFKCISQMAPICILYLMVPWAHACEFLNGFSSGFAFLYSSVTVVINP